MKSLDAKGDVSQVSPWVFMGTFDGDGARGCVEFCFARRERLAGI